MKDSENSIQEKTISNDERTINNIIKQLENLSPDKSNEILKQVVTGLKKERLRKLDELQKQMDELNNSIKLLGEING